MASDKSINMKLVLFCIAFVTVLALTECNEDVLDVLGGSSSNEVNVVDNIRVRGESGDYDLVKDYKPDQEDGIKFCSKECTPALPCWCCDRRGRTTQCFPNLNDCNRYCA